MNGNSFDYFDRMYLCIQNKGTFECEKYDSYEAVKKSKNGTIKTGMSKEANGVLPREHYISTFVPICKYSPEFLDSVILKYKLHNLMRIKIVKPKVAHDDITYK
jgi:hypothetical protein